MAGTAIAIGTGAVLGALGRYYISRFCLGKFGNTFPCGTLFVNLTGAVLMGIAVSCGVLHQLPNELETLIIVGFLGSYTTFSTYALDIVNLWRNQRYLSSFFYAAGSLLVGFIGILIGLHISSLFN